MLVEEAKQAVKRTRPSCGSSGPSNHDVAMQAVSEEKRTQEGHVLTRDEKMRDAGGPGRNQQSRSPSDGGRGDYRTVVPAHGGTLPR